MMLFPCVLSFFHPVTKGSQRTWMVQLFFHGHSMADGAAPVGPNGVGIILILLRLEIAGLFSVSIVRRVKGVLRAMA